MMLNFTASNIEPKSNRLARRRNEGRAFHRGALPPIATKQNENEAANVDGEHGFMTRRVLESLRRKF